MPNPKEILFAAEDEFGKIMVIEEQGCRKLVFDTEVEQGCLFLEAPMQIAFEYQEVVLQQIEQWQTQKNQPHLSSNENPLSTKNLQHNSSLNMQQPMRVLMLGLGSGTLGQHLLNRFDLNLTVLELRQTVIDCAYEFFAFPDTPDVDVLQADAIEFCQDHTYPYDVIIVDIFDAKGEAGQLSDPKFLNQLWQLPKNNGLLIFNLWHEWQNNLTDKSGTNLKATPASQQVLDFWQNFANSNKAINNHNDNPLLEMNRYNIASSQNLVLTLHKKA